MHPAPAPRLRPVLLLGLALCAAPVAGMLAAGVARARPIASPFIQDMVRAEIPDPLPAAPDTPSLKPLRISGELIGLGHTPLVPLARRLGVPVEHQRDSGQAIGWVCIRLDVPSGTAPSATGSALSLWLVSDSQTSGSAEAVDAIAIDTIRPDGHDCAVPRRDAGLTLDPRLALPGQTVQRAGQLLGEAPPRAGRAAYQLTPPRSDDDPLTLTLSTRGGRVEALWLAAAADN